MNVIGCELQVSTTCCTVTKRKNLSKFNILFERIFDISQSSP